MIQELDVKAKIAALLRDEISAIDFVRWIMANSWNMHRDSSDRAVDLVSDIHLLFAERDDKSLDDQAFLAELRELVSLHPRDVWISANVPVRVSLDFDSTADFLPKMVNAASNPFPRWLRPALAEL